MSDSIKDIVNKLQAPFKASEIEWRVQSQGKTKTGGKIWCTVLAYVDARALQTRLDDVFTPFGWEDKYEPLNDDFICTLTVDYNGKKVSKQNGASKTQVEGFKGGISNSFKRVCASGFGIGRYLYDLEVKFAEVTTENMSKDSSWKKGSIKTDNRHEIYYWKIPTLPREYLPVVETITAEQAERLKELSKLKNQKLSIVLQRFNIKRLGELSNEAFNTVMTEWGRL